MQIVINDRPYLRCKILNIVVPKLRKNTAIKNRLVIENIKLIPNSPHSYFKFCSIISSDFTRRVLVHTVTFNSLPSTTLNKVIPLGGQINYLDCISKFFLNVCRFMSLYITNCFSLLPFYTFLM